MALTCYNKGCGQKFDADKNNDDSCLFHAGVPIFHDALKGWSCCKKRTTDFSEFLSIQGCTRGRHSNEKPHEPLLPEVSSDKGRIKHTNNGQEIIYQGPKSAEKLQKERPSSDEPMTKLPYKVSASLAKELEKLDITKKAKDKENESQTVMAGTRCKNAGCKTVYQSPETDLEICTHHPGGPVFHEGYKYWSCCCIKTIDFNAFLDQKGCTAGKHRWVPKQDKKKVACRFDWHQTGKNVVVTIYAKNTNPEISFVEANRTVLSCQLQFENDKIFKKEFHLWGVIDVKQSSINMVPSKVEIYLRKADPVSWGKLEDPNYKPPPEPADDPFQESVNDFYNNPDYDIDDDDISESDEEWSNEMAPQKTEEQEAQKKKEEAITAFHTKELEEEMKRVSEQQKKEEEDRKRKEELRKQDEEEGFDEMPDLE